MNWKHAFLASDNDGIHRYMLKDSYIYIAGIVHDGSQKFAFFSGRVKETRLRYFGLKEGLQDFLQENELTKDWTPGFINEIGMTVEGAIKKARDSRGA
jgi:hypothetical protein